MRYLLLLTLMLSAPCVLAQDGAAWFAVMELPSGFPAWNSRPYDYAAAYTAYPSVFNEADATVAYTNGPAHGQGSSAFFGSSVAQDGRIVFVPFNSTVIGLYDPVSNTYSNGPAHGRGAGAFSGSSVAQDGRIVFVPFNSTVIGLYDPVSNTYSNGPAHGRGYAAFLGSSVAQDGRIVLVPRNSTVIGVLSGWSGTLPLDAVMSPLFNGF